VEGRRTSLFALPVLSLKSLTLCAFFFLQAMLPRHSSQRSDLQHQHALLVGRRCQVRKRCVRISPLFTTLLCPSRISALTEDWPLLLRCSVVVQLPPTDASLELFPPRLSLLLPERPRPAALNHGTGSPCASHPFTVLPSLHFAFTANKIVVRSPAVRSRSAFRTLPSCLTAEESRHAPTRTGGMETRVSSNPPCLHFFRALR
jgi:hypothetical protein